MKIEEPQSERKKNADLVYDQVVVRVESSREKFRKAMFYLVANLLETVRARLEQASAPNVIRYIVAQRNRLRKRWGKLRAQENWKFFYFIARASAQGAAPSTLVPCSITFITFGRIYFNWQGISVCLRPPSFFQGIQAISIGNSSGSIERAAFVQI